MRCGVVRRDMAQHSTVRRVAERSGMIISCRRLMHLKPDCDCELLEIILTWVGG